MAGKYLDVNAENISYQLKRGVENKKVVLVIHGATANGISAMPIAESLHHHGYGYVVIDLPRHGLSGGEIRTSVSEFADAVENFISRLHETEGIAEVVIAGISMGGAIALELAARHTVGVRSIAIINSSPDFTHFAELPTDPEELGKFMGKEFTTSTDLQANIKIMTEINSQPTSLDVSQADLKACQKFNIIDRLAEIEIPAIIIAGDQDGLALLANQFIMRNKIKSSYLSIYPNRGHFISIELPNEIATDIAHFLEVF